MTGWEILAFIAGFLCGMNATLQIMKGKKR